MQSSNASSSKCKLHISHILECSIFDQQVLQISWLLKMDLLMVANGCIMAPEGGFSYGCKLGASPAAKDGSDYGCKWVHHSC
ncbi:unnamed protein product [Sphagnum troendelagicum]|uniref:Uncharacterized protein n=3 Tax=Sphagnum TaxID=13804 RepID=A0ABP0U1X8_9BRYO